MTGALDNDVLYKGACYDLLVEFATFVDPLSMAVGVLGAAPYVVRALLIRADLQADNSTVLERFERFLRTVGILDPTEPEQALAAAIELAAQRQGLPLHSGESQLCAIAVTRGFTRVLTGDKHAIVAMEDLLNTRAELEALAGRVHCLEQAILAVSQSIGTPAVRTHVCSEPSVDTALSMCFSCASGASWTDASLDGLQSYIRSLRANAARVLAA